MPRSSENFVVIGGNGNHELDRHTIKVLNERLQLRGHPPLAFTHLDIDRFPDGEPDLRIQDRDIIAGRHALLLQSIENVQLMEEMLLLAWCLKNMYGAKSLTAIINFFRYRRQDHPEKPHEITASHMLIDALVRGCGVDRIFFTEIHSQATIKHCLERNIEAWNVNAAPAFASHLQPLVEEARAQGHDFRIHAPDIGAIDRALRLAKALEVGISATPKRRAHDGRVEIIDDPEILRNIQKSYDTEIVFGNFKDSCACIFDDELASGGTAVKCGRRLLEKGAPWVAYAAVHPVCTPGWKRTFVDSGVFAPRRMFLGNTLDRSAYRYSTGGKVIRVRLSPLTAEEIYSKFVSRVI